MAQTTKVANRDAANFLSLKTRQAGQGLREERGSRRELQEDLEKREKKAKEERDGKKDKKENKQAALEENPFPEDADEEVPDDDEPKSEAGDDEDEDEDTEELMRELAKIKKEREAAEEAQKAQQAKLDERARRDEIMQGNPLLQSTDLSLKRKWDDDTVFKNQARTAPKTKPRYINDAVRSDFHKKFLNKYVWVDGVAH